MRSSIRNPRSIWLRILFLSFYSWVHGNKPHKCTSWVGVCENELPLSPDSSHATGLNPILMLPEKLIIKGLPMNTFLIKERSFSWKAKRYIWKFRTPVVVQRKVLEQDNGKKAGWLSLPKPPKAECQIATYCPSAPSSLLCSLLCDAGVGTFASSFLPLSPRSEAFYLILPIGGARGRLKGEKREAFLPSLSSSLPPPPHQEHLPRAFSLF